MGQQAKSNLRKKHVLPCLTPQNNFLTNLAMINRHIEMQMIDNVSDVKFSFSKNRNNNQAIKTTNINISIFEMIEPDALIVRS